MAMLSQVKNIIVFGASGQTGLHILKKGIAEELGVTAFIRSPEKIPEDIREKLRKVIQGDVFDKQKVEDAIEGHDAVLSALGDGAAFWGRGTVSQGGQNIIDGMKKHQVKRLVLVGTALWLPDQSGFFVGLARKLGVIKDHSTLMGILQNNKDIDWVLALPPHIKNSTVVNPDYKVQKDTLPGGDSVTTAELADFMINVVRDNSKMEEFKQCNVGISSHPKTS